MSGDTPDSQAPKEHLLQSDQPPRADSGIPVGAGLVNSSSTMRSPSSSRAEYREPATRRAASLLHLVGGRAQDRVASLGPSADREQLLKDVSRQSRKTVEIQRVFRMGMNVQRNPAPPPEVQRTSA